MLLPTLGLMWAVIAVLAAYHYNREEEVRTQSIKRQLELAGNNIIAAYEKGIDIDQFTDFVREYYENTLYSGIRVSVYDYTGKLVNSVGKPIPFEFRNFENMMRNDANAEMMQEMSEDSHAFTKELFCYIARKSYDGKLFVLTAMPYTQSLDYTLQHRNRIWLVVFALAMAASAFVLMFVHHVSRSVKMLAGFAQEVAAGTPITLPDDKIPTDEFGRITRLIISLFREKDQAMKAREREHKVATNAIVEKARLKREMSNNINHELKTPVGIIKGYIDTVMAQPDMDPETMRHFLGRAQTNVDRLCSLLNDLSTITRLDDGGQQITISEVDFHDLVFTLADDVENSGVLGDMTFEYDIPLNCHVRGNMSLLQGFLHNLVRNASRHSKGTRMGVEYVTENDRCYTFRFYDDGVGVPPESIPRLFDRFYRVDMGRSRKSGDTGLGLTIVMSTIQALGGAISVKNRSTGGLEFTFTLLKWKPQPGDAPAAETPATAPAE